MILARRSAFPSFIRALAALPLHGPAISSAQESDWPSRTIQIVVPGTLGIKAD
jgi:hypothetical protein